METIGTSVKIGDEYTGASFNYQLSNAPSLYLRANKIKRRYQKVFENNILDLFSFAKECKLPRRLMRNENFIIEELMIRITDIADKATLSQIEVIEECIESGDLIKPFKKY